MHMLNQVVEEVNNVSPIEDSELDSFMNLLQVVKEETEQINLEISVDRWTLIGVHLLAFTRRIRNKETLPPIDPAMLEESNQDFKAISKKVLQIYGDQYNTEIEPIEVFLMQVHLETAKALQQEA
ncbi:PRD domain-containing protein [Brevibacillus daliensis]|uniref:PRD domain-containing protein n=1 Tax=Brevibacillus daliensis TaxID=2892995 RepID=UPI001E5E00EE|nr:PRD domain-containing protein [Brevibacillus daliensis]